MSVSYRRGEYQDPAVSRTEVLYRRYNLDVSLIVVGKAFEHVGWDILLLRELA